MALTAAPMAMATAPKRLNFFERYLTLWVGLCMVAGLALGRWAPELVREVSQSHGL